jgi:hypothetical protein
MDFSPLTDAYGWKAALRYIIRDRAAIYGDVFIRRVCTENVIRADVAPESPELAK